MFISKQRLRPDAFGKMFLQKVLSQGFCYYIYYYFNTKIVINIFKEINICRDFC